MITAYQTDVVRGVSSCRPPIVAPSYPVDQFGSHQPTWGAYRATL